MSDFQLTLIGAGAALVAAVWGYNLWQERRAHRAAERVFRGTQPDVLFDEEVDTAGPGTNDEMPVADPEARIEPGFDRLEPIIGDGDENAQAGGETAAQAEPDAALADTVTEMAVALHFEQPQAGRVLWQAVQTLPARVQKRLRWVGYGDGGWREASADDGDLYSEARALLQLADRQGPMGEEELRPLIEALERLAAEAGGRANVPSLPDVLAHARSLDDFCAGMDIQMAVHVVSRSGEPFAGTKLRSLLQAAGFELRSDGLFHLPDAQGTTVLSVSNFGAAPFVADELRQLTTVGVTFWLDVPRVQDGAAVFDRLVATARQLADAVDGQLVDDQRHPLADAALTGIRAKIAEIQQQMASVELPAGGRRALRLFR